MRFSPSQLRGAVVLTAMVGVFVAGRFAVHQSPERSSVPLTAAINPNTAGLQELAALPGIGQTRARALVAYRQTHGRFSRLEDLDAIPGIGPATLERLAPHVTFGDR
jgi:competence protein ComEA